MLFLKKQGKKLLSKYKPIRNNKFQNKQFKKGKRRF
jgi:hypothetical protein